MTALALVLAHQAVAEEATVVAADLSQTGSGWRVDVTIAHPDTGWDHYADGWSVQLEDGTELGYRTLHHPHVDEQPFTRSLGGLTLPSGTTRVFIRAHDSVHGWSQNRFEVAVP